MPTKKTTKQTASKVSARKTTSARKVTANKKAEGAKESAKSSVPSTKETLNTHLHNPRLWVGVVVVLLAILVYAGRGLLVAAVVNGQPISRLSVVQQLEKQGGKDALDGLISQALIQQEAQKEHVTVSQSDISAAEAQIESALKSQGTNLNDALAARGMTKQQLDSQVALDQMLTRMVEKNVNVTDQQVQDYINQNKDNLPQNLSDDQLQQQVRQQLKEQQLTTLKQDFVSNLQKKASIQTFVSY